MKYEPSEIVRWLQQEGIEAKIDKGFVTLNVKSPKGKKASTALVIDNVVSNALMLTRLLAKRDEDVHSADFYQQFGRATSLIPQGSGQGVVLQIKVPLEGSPITDRPNLIRAIGNFGTQIDHLPEAITISIAPPTPDELLAEDVVTAEAFGPDPHGSETGDPGPPPKKTADRTDDRTDDRRKNPPPEETNDGKNPLTA